MPETIDSNGVLTHITAMPYNSKQWRFRRLWQVLWSPSPQTRGLRWAAALLVCRSRHCPQPLSIVWLPFTIPLSRETQLTLPRQQSTTKLLPLMFPGAQIRHFDWNWLLVFLVHVLVYCNWRQNRAYNDWYMCKYSLQQRKQAAALVQHFLRLVSVDWIKLWPDDVIRGVLLAM